jgi:macrolide transport system ATP-binding/permease protein
MVCKSRGFTALAVLTLALGIGANTAIFSVLDPLLLRKLPVPNPDELVWINSAGTLGEAEISEGETFRIYRDNASAFSSIFAFSPAAPYDIAHSGRTLNASGEIVSGNYFTELGVRPFVGRFFNAADERGSSVMVLGFDFWKREFDSDANIVGKAISFGDQSDASRSSSPAQKFYTVVGVAPPGFFGVKVGELPDFYVPLGAADLPSQDYWQSQFVTILGRLRLGVSLAQAQANLQPLLERAEKTSTLPAIEVQESFTRVALSPAARGLSEARAKFSLPARILMAVVGLVLLIACANVANLLLARGMARKREFTVRLALGAGPWRLIRQLLTESALLAIAGAAAGLAAGYWASGLLVASLSTKRLPVVLATALNGRTLFFTTGVLVVAVLSCGLAPALSAVRGQLAADLKAQGSASHRSSAQSRIGRLLVVGQVALSVILLTGAGLFLHSLINLESFDAGFDRDKVVILAISGCSVSRTRDQIAAFYDQLLERAKHLPGVHSASYSSFTPLSGKEVGVNVIVDGYTLQPGEEANERFVGVSPGYFQTMGIPLLEGREFTEADVHSNSPSYQSTSVAIINRTMSHRFFGDSSPLGRHFRFVEGTRPPLEIVGVVGDSKYIDLREKPMDFFYVPGTHGDLEVRLDGSAKTLDRTLRELVRSLDSSVKVAGIQTVRQQVDESLHPDRLVAALCSVFSALALALTCVGLYGTLAFSVARRTSEIGIRMALGAHPRDISRLIIGQGMKLTIFGLLLGVAAAFVSTSWLASLLFGVKQADPLTLGGVSTVLLGAGVLACYIPARRATRVDLLAALRDE